MANLYVAEFPSVSNVGGHLVPTGSLPPLVEQFIAISGVSQQLAAFHEKTTFIRVHCDGACFIAVGSNPTASTTGLRLATNQTEYFGVRRGDILAVVA